ncbi:MAG: hypothetical protein Q8J78_04550 [Moraxellaceae bacterium]|nr:hypothetical protein [Moraxellaceae bacterium]
MKTLVAILLLVLAVPAQADLLLGARVGQQQLGIKESLNGVVVSDTSLTTKSALSLVVGAGMPGAEGGRLSAEFASYTFGDGALDVFALGYQHLLPALNTHPLYRLRPFVGGDAGYGRLVRDAQPLFGRSDDKGLNAGPRGGLNLTVGERAEVELGLRYTWLGLTAEQQGAGGTAVTEIRDNRAWWIGFNIGM